MNHDPGNVGRECLKVIISIVLLRLKFDLFRLSPVGVTADLLPVEILKLNWFFIHLFPGISRFDLLDLNFFFRRLFL